MSAYPAQMSELRKLHTLQTEDFAKLNLAEPASIDNWLRSQAINSTRHAAALRPFNKGEFGSNPASPSEAHRQAVNALLQTLRAHLVDESQRLAGLYRRISESDENQFLIQRFTALKENASNWTKATEKVWDYYFELFNQRQSHVAEMLLACDRVALDCYQAVYTKLNEPRSIPSPGPFCYLDAGFAPATFRRYVKLSKLGKLENPFPLVKLPYHRLVNPWTLGAVAHETSHNLQSDLKLWREIPRAIARNLLRRGFNKMVTGVWVRWHKEMFADLCGLLLIGPSFVFSLMDILARSTARTAHFNPKSVHPTPYLRVFINLELLFRMGFDADAQAIRDIWNQLYPKSVAAYLPRAFMSSFNRALKIVVDTICYQQYQQLGNRTLAQTTAFRPQDQVLVAQAAERLAAGTDPGIIPARFLIGAARSALDRNLVRPESISQNFYNALVRR